MQKPHKHTPYQENIVSFSMKENIALTPLDTYIQFNKELCTKAFKQKSVVNPNYLNAISQQHTNSWYLKAELILKTKL